MIERRRAMETVHQQQLRSFNSVTEKRKADNCEKIRAETEQMMAIHAELTRMVLLKGLCLEEDNDDSLVPRKLFLFKIEDFQKGPQIIETPFTQMRDVDPPNTSKESLADQTVHCVTSPKEKKLSMVRRFLKFFGLRNTA